MSPSTHFKPRHGGVKRATTTCTTGGFYKSPKQGATVDTSSSLLVQWDTTCILNPKASKPATAADIYLFMPAADKPRIHMWTNVDFHAGQYAVNLEPKWWNATKDATLQFAIVEHGQQPFTSPYPAAPIFHATYTPPKDGSVPDSANINKPDADGGVTNATPQHHGPSKGGVAAAVLMPLLAVALLAVGWYIKKTRGRGQEKRKRFQEHVDKRMSTISTDWKSITTAGAQAAIRHSMVGGPNNNNSHRLSSFSFGNIRPSSTVAVEGGDVTDTEGEAPAMSQLRPVRSSAYTERTSRAISFADDPRPSMGSRKNVTSRAFHNAIVPPLPTRLDSGGEISPTQTNGPMSLSPDDIRARLSGASSQTRPSMDEVLPALSMMRNGGDGSFADDNFFEQPQLPTPPTPTHHPLTSSTPIIDRSPIMGLMPMQAMPANVMSPDEMLRAYAERTRTHAPSISPPLPIASGGGGMRVLYSPPSAENSLALPPVGGVRASGVSEMSRYEDEEDTAVWHGLAQ